MLGLILKDLYNIKSMARLYILFAIFYTFLAITSGDSTFLAFMLFILCAMLPLAAMAFDEKAKWDQYGLTMPISRKDIVMSKYLLSLVTFGFAAVLLLILNFIIPGDAAEFFTGFLPLVLGVAIIMLSIILPIHFKFGVEKGRIIMVMIYIIPTALVMLLAKLDVNVIQILEYILDIYTPLRAIFVASMALAVSIMASLKVYENKEV